jgi:Na+-translocating ferredoxin:NAD+ oxidoreductase RnfG subunit
MEATHMAELEISAVVLAMLALKGAALLALVYVGARLAIRHERRASN